MLIRTLIAFAIVIAAQTSTVMATDQTLKLGVFLCQTGSCAETGIAALRGAQLAAEELNNRGGVLGRKVLLVIQDTREAEAGKNALTAYQALSSDPEINFMIGPTWDAGGLPVLPLIKGKKDLIVVSPSIGVGEFSAAADNLFNLWPLDETAVKRLAEFAVTNNWKKAALLSGQNNWAQNQARMFKSEYEKLGGKVVGVEEPLLTQGDVRAEVLRLQKNKPDIVLFTLFVHMPIASKIFREVGFGGRFFAVQLDAARIDSSRGSLEGTIFPRYPEASPEFRQVFKKRFSAEPQLSADMGYDAVYLFARGIEQAKSFDPMLVKQVLSKISFTGASGKIEFNAIRAMTREPQLFELRGNDGFGLDG